MSEYLFVGPARLSNGVFGGSTPAENFRVLTLLLLLGQGSVVKTRGGVKKSLSRNYLVVPHQSSTQKRISDIVALFDDSTSRKLSAFFKDNYAKNLSFHRNINKEMLSAIGSQEFENNIACFLFVYRIVEQISLCLPMVTLIRKATFHFTLKDYQLLIEGTAKSDLSVLRKYSENVLEENLGNVGISLDFAGCQNPKQNVDLVLDLIPMKAQPKVIISSTATGVQLKLKYLHTLIVSFRNEYFHYLFHERNISFDRLENPDEFLSVCNPAFQNYIAMLYLDLLNSEFFIWG